MNRKMHIQEEKPVFLELPRTFEMKQEGVRITETILKSEIPMTDYCRRKLHFKRHGRICPTTKISGGFYNAGRTFDHQIVSEDIQILSLQSGRKFRLGNSFELLLYIKLGLPVPKFFVSLAKIWDNKPLFWYPFDSGTKFHLYHHIGKWRKDCPIFIIEEII